ncbi:choice-of-anchor D domain-containing protein [Bacteroidetes/Chlorobi group bacterium Naka2016]|jgi:Mg-chelatase subunit ChlD|nr:MAG: choice-of-anchor D domain-containing protein [Bacteroidetes/Chlorobi group bacterium Naka2016]
MKRSFLVLAILLLFRQILISQEATFSISEVDASRFPLIRCTFIALDATGKSYTDLKPSDFDVFERGKNMNPTVNVDCKDTLVEPAVSIILIVDQSESMRWLNEAGEQRWSWVLRGVEAFVNTINFKTGTKVGLISFGRVAYKRCDFTDNKQEILDSLNNTVIGGGTLYDPPFLDRINGAITMFLNGSPDPQKRRIIVFLTDGEPNDPPKTDSIVKELQRINAQVYAITLAMPMHKSLEEISSKTGGKAYKVETKQELEDIYRFIALDIQKKQLCQLTWVTDFGCDKLDLIRPIKITFKRQAVTIERDYVAPDYSIAKLPIDGAIYDFLDPAPNTSNDLDITITTPVADYTINDIKIIPSTYYQVINWDVGGSGGAPPFVIPASESRTIRVRFTQGAVRSYREATLYIDAKPCPAQVKLIGGISQVRIISPNGGEIYSICDTINIVWSGVESDKPINLFYSTDGGNSWRPIASNVKGLSYKWIPPVGGNNLRIRATVAPVSNYIWAKAIGGTEDDFGRSIAVTEDNSYLYITGSFSGTIEFENNKKFTSAGGLDIFVAKYDRDGNLIWVQTAGGYGTDTAAGICVDRAGNAYVVGTCQQTATFGYISPNIPIKDAPYCFIAKYPASGSTPIVTLIGPDQTYSNFKAWGQKIKYKVNQAPNPDEIVILGEYVNQIQTVLYSLPKVTVPTTFTGVLYPDMTVKYTQKGGTDDGTFSKSVAYDGIGDRYEVGTFTGTLVSGNITITSKGKNDVFIRRYGGSPGSQDVSDTVFSIQNPVWVLASNSYDFGDCTVGDVKPIVLDAYICNRGNVPIVIANTAFIGSNPADFRIGATLIGKRLMPGDCIPVELAFVPKDVGARNAQLVITPDCGSELVLNLSGFGVCTGEALSKVNLGPSNLSVKVTKSVQCIFKNTNPASVPVKFVIYGPNASDFSIPISSLIVKPGECVDLDVSFIPSGAGLRVAYLKFELPPGCINPETELNGIGVDADIVIEPIDWNGRRLKTQNDTDLVIINRSSIAQKLLDIQFQDNIPNFEFVNNPPIPLPYTVQSGDSIKIPIRFTPDEEVQYSNTLILKFEGLLSDLYGNVRGEGILPRIELKWTCLDAVKPGEQGMAELEVSNPSTTADLVIYKMDFKYKTGDFNWVNGVPTNEVIPKSSNKVYEVYFTPQTPGTRADLIEITHDAAPGPEKYPRIDTTFDAECDGLGLTAVKTIDFGNSIICDDNAYDLKVINDSWITPITITSYEITGSGSEAFKLLENMPIVVPPSNFVTLKLVFDPQEAKDYNAVLTFKTSINSDIVINLTGKGVLVDFYSDNPEWKLEPTFSRKLNVKGRIPKLYNANINSLDLNIYYNPKMIRIDTIRPSPSLQNWVWEPPTLVERGKVNLKGSGSLATGFDLELFTIEFTVFLGDVKETTFDIEMKSNGCLAPLDVISKIIISNVCFVDGRLITLSDTPYFITLPEPNPVVDKINFKFGVAFDEPVNVSLINIYGQTIKTFVDENLKAGIYEVNSDVSNISNGVYYLKLISGSYQKILPIIIAK